MKRSGISSPKTDDSFLTQYEQGSDSEESIKLSHSQPKKSRLDDLGDDSNIQSCSDSPSIKNPHSVKPDRLAEISALIDQCSHGELVHIKNTIKPLLKRDFISCLPFEVSLRILSYLPLRDILNCTQVSRSWYNVSNDKLLWYQLCKRAGLHDYYTTEHPKSMHPPLDGSLMHSFLFQSKYCTSNVFQSTRSDHLTDLCNADQSTSDHHISLSGLHQTIDRPDSNLSFPDRNLSDPDQKFLNLDQNHVITCLEVYKDWAITGSDDSSICVWSLLTGRCLINLFGHLGGVWSMTLLLPNSKPNPVSMVENVDSQTDNDLAQFPLLISGSYDRTARVWQLDGTNWPCIATLFGHQSTVRCVAGQKFYTSVQPKVVGSEENFQLDEQQQQQDEDEGCHDQSSFSQFSPNTRLVVTGSRDTTLRLWNAQTGECIREFRGHRGAIRCVQFTGQRIVSGSYDCTVRLWCIIRGHCLHVFTAHTNRVYTLLFDGFRIISGSLDTTIRVWETSSGKLERTFYGHSSLTSEMVFGEAQNILVSSNADKTIRVWDVGTGECLHVLAGPNKHQSAVTCVQLTKNFIISSSDDGTVKLWEKHTGTYIRDLLRLDGAGRGGVIWRIVASEQRLVCATGSRNGMESTKLVILKFGTPLVHLMCSHYSKSNSSLLSTSSCFCSDISNEHRCQRFRKHAPSPRLSQMLISSSSEAKKQFSFDLHLNT